MNNRELKFRVWNNEQKKFEYFELHNITVPDRLLTQHKYPVQQFTELYDNNKKPIYEGDRVRFGYSENHEFFGEVIYLEDRASFGVRYKNTFETLEDVPMDHMKYFEVIGNIFETENYKKVYSDDVKPSGKKYNSVSEIMKDLKNGK